ncbi:nucleoside deaminase, partial [Enterococcus cecorum]|nr:nucleoside deaminase [Enterococcus cecorum]
MEKRSSLTQEQKEYFMQEAIKEAKKAEQMAEVPIGAVVVYQGEIIGRGHNQRETQQQAAAHAEMFAIQEACEKVDSWRLESSQLFVTLEPCVMCSGAIQLARVEEIYFGAFDPKGGACGSLLNIATDERFNHWSYVESGI